MTPTTTAYQIPLGLKVFYSLFLLVFIPSYLSTYGPTVFLYFCDVALLLTFVGLWSNNNLLVSMAGVGILVPQLVWMFDLLFGMLNLPLLGSTDYMFDDSIDLMARLLSLFHAWLPLLILYLVYHRGYQPKAYIYWNIIAYAIILIGYFLLPAPGDLVNLENTPVNINYVFGFSQSAKQTWMPDWAYLLVVLLAVPTLISLPAHFLLKKIGRLKIQNAA